MQATTTPQLIFKNLNVSYLDVVDQLESASYPEDEKATREKLHLRLTRAPELFMGAFVVVVKNNEDDRKEEEILVGYVCSTKTSQESLTHESMSRHEEEGRTVCIHSVVVRDSWRKRGVGSQMMQQYLRLPFMQHVDQLLLLSKEHLIPFYEKAGFELLGLSPVDHGSEKWYDLRYVVNKK